MTGWPRIVELIADVAYPGLRFEVAPDETWLRVRCDEGLDNAAGEPAPWTGRKWRLSPHMTDGEVVQTALLAVFTALEHEAREKFTFRGVALFGPHLDIYRLVELARDPTAVVERPPAAEPTQRLLDAPPEAQLGRPGQRARVVQISEGHPALLARCHVALASREPGEAEISVGGMAATLRFGRGYELTIGFAENGCLEVWIGEEGAR
jgi:hypothetical protein